MKRQKQNTALRYSERLNIDRRVKEEGWVLGGMNLMGGMTAVALNNLYGFGKDRLKKVEDEVNRMWIEEFGEDYEAAEAKMQMRLERIRGKGWERE